MDNNKNRIKDIVNELEQISMNVKFNDYISCNDKIELLNKAYYLKVELQRLKAN